VGQVLGSKLPEKTVRVGASLLFVVFGLLLLWEAVR
jgi:putative Ca2+/H+ antiporter (TMEM165/GDT1 family)